MMLSFSVNHNSREFVYNKFKIFDCIEINYKNAKEYGILIYKYILLKITLNTFAKNIKIDTVCIF